MFAPWCDDGLISASVSVSSIICGIFACIHVCRSRILMSELWDVAVMLKFTRKVDWEQPIFTTKAHVFQIDPNTKKKWLPASTQAINVSYYFDSSRNTYRIISVEGSKAVINSTITPNMTFTKTSQKFGQWSDSRANTVYGLGFSSEAELLKFVDKFKEVKELMRQLETSQQPATNGTDAANHINIDNANVPSPAGTPKHSASTAQSSTDNDRSSPSSAPSLPSSHTETQLKYENDRLKIALAQSSANAKKWEVELQTLKNNNVRLTTALQESTANVEEWKRQLAAYKEESARMKRKVIELERSGGHGDSGSHSQVAELTDKLTLMERDKQQRTQEIDELTSRVAALEPFEEQNKDLMDRLKSLEAENERLRGQVHDLKQQVADHKASQARDHQALSRAHQQLESKIAELSQVRSAIASVLQT